MNREDWRDVERLFQAVVDLPPMQRAELLRQRGETENTLVQEVESLLTSHDQEWALLDTPPREDMARLLTAIHHDPLIGQRLGSYEVVRELGRGGMSTVYLAMRADHQYRQQVAIKLIKRGMDTDSIIARFLQERQILANLTHPSIAKLLDGGTTEDGRPYVVMEYIQGEPVDRYCDRQRLTIDQRLDLFRAICEAVHHAHQNLVIHRDLKASNILVNAEGVPKLLDFGTAKLLAPIPESTEVGPTASGIRLLTPSTASPEQIRGGPITTASDVYSLGVLLLTLLTGHRPYKTAGRRLEEIAEIVCDQAVERPSILAGRPLEILGTEGSPSTVVSPQEISHARRTQPERLTRRLRGDLDNIVLMALRKEPQRRYSSVEQFSRDIRHHQQALPVLARQDTLGYRTKTFIRRHRAGVLTITLLLLTLLAATAATTWQARVATVERQRAQAAATQALAAQEKAEAQRATAEQVAKFLVDLFKGSSPWTEPGRELSALELLAQGAERISSDLTDQPLVRATLMDTIGGVYRDLGRFEEAAPLLEQALEIRRQVLGEKHPDIAWSLDHIARLRTNQGELEAAEALFRQALSMRRELLGEDHPKVGQSLINLGVVLHEMGKYPQAEVIWREALERSRRLQSEDDPERAAILNNLAGILVALGDLDGAELLFRETLERNLRVLPKDHPALATQLYNLADVVREQGNLEEAEALAQQALTLWRKVLGEDHPLVGYGLDGVAQVLRQKGDLAAAEAVYRQALELRTRVLPPGHPAIADSALGLGQLLLDQGKPALAEPLLSQALAIRRLALPAGNWTTAQAASLSGACLRSLGREDEAGPLLLEGLETLRATFGETHRETRKAAQRFATLHHSLGSQTPPRTS